MAYRIITEAPEKTVHRFLSGEFTRDKEVRGRYAKSVRYADKPILDLMILDQNPITNEQLKDYRAKFKHDKKAEKVYVYNPQTCITGSVKEKGLALTLYEEMRRIRTRLNANAWSTHLFKLEDTK